jgi:membrane protease YdiL (CAAX protease family)
MWALVIGGVVHLLLFIWAWKRLEHKPFSAMLLAFSRHLWRPLFFGLIVGLGEILLVFGILAVIGSAHIEWGGASISSQGWFVVSSLLAPILEEIECRGYLFQNVKRGWGATLAVIVTAAVFAARHMQNPNVNTLGLVNIALISIVFTVGMLRFRSLWFPIGWHASWNFAQFFLFGLPNSGYSPDGLGLPGTTLLVSQISGPIWLTGGKFGLEGSAISTIVLLGILLWLWKGFKTESGGLEDLPPSDRGEESNRDPVGEPRGHPIQKTNVAPVQKDVDVPFR